MCARARSHLNQRHLYPPKRQHLSAFLTISSESNINVHFKLFLCRPNNQRTDTIFGACALLQLFTGVFFDFCTLETNPEVRMTFWKRGIISFLPVFQHNKRLSALKLVVKTFTMQNPLSDNARVYSLTASGISYLIIFSYDHNIRVREEMHHNKCTFKRRIFRLQRGFLQINE